jgi:hypothetical protein
LHEPSLGPAALVGVDSIDATVMQGMLAMVRETQGDGWSVSGRIGGATGNLAPRLGSTLQSRSLGFGDLTIQLLQSRGAAGMRERLRVHTTQGRTRDRYQRTVFALALETTGQDVVPLAATVTYGSIVGRPHPFELFTVGGIKSPVGNSSLFSQRYAMPAYPTGTITGNAILAWRVEVPSEPWTLFYESASTAMDVARFTNWIRAIGFDTHFVLPPIPVAFVPRIEMRAGAAYTLDDPFPKRVRGFFSVQYEP